MGGRIARGRGLGLAPIFWPVKGAKITKVLPVPEGSFLTSAWISLLLLEKGLTRSDKAENDTSGAGFPA